MSSTISVSITCEDETVNLNVFVDDFCFVKFSSWLKTRFGLEECDRIIFRDQHGQGQSCKPLKHIYITDSFKSFSILIECLPSKGLFSETSKLFVEKLQKKKDKTDSTKTSSKSTENPYFLPAAFVLLAVVVYSFKFSSNNPINVWLDYYEGILIEWDILAKRGVLVDAFVSCFCWGIPYLFIRRLMNPETTNDAFSKYAKDSIFGGFAATGQAIMKHILMTSMASKAQEKYYINIKKYYVEYFYNLLLANF